MNRREFLKCVGAGAAGAMLGAGARAMWAQPAPSTKAAGPYLVVKAPSDVVAGKAFTVEVVPLTPAGDLHRNYTGKLSLTVEGQAGAPISIELKDQSLIPEGKPADQFKKGTAQVSVPKPGFYRLVVTDGEATVGFPVKCHAAEPKEKLYWGEIHCHSDADKDAVHGGGSLDPARAFSWGRNVACLDFGSIVCHHWSFDEKRWLEIARIINAADDPGKFVALMAWEFGQGDRPGERINHNNVYFLGDSAPWPPNMGSIDEFWPWLEKNSKAPTLCIPHHTAFQQIRTEWKTHNPKYQQLVEVFSTHGNSECEGDAFPGVCTWKPGYVHNALEKGYFLGFICGSDNHGGRLGTNSRVGCRAGGKRTGLAAFRAPELTRKALFQTIQDRNTYGTSGAQRIILEVSMNGHRGGEKFAAGTDPRKLSVEVAGTADIAKIEVVKNAKVVHSVEGKSWHEKMEFADKADRATDWYYVRVTQTDDNLAWSSPIWARSDGRG